MASEAPENPTMALLRMLPIALSSDAALRSI